VIGLHVVPREESSDHTCLDNQLQLDNCFKLRTNCHIMPLIDGRAHNNNRLLENLEQILRDKFLAAWWPVNGAFVSPGPRLDSAGTAKAPFSIV